jgi:lysophospholipase L1-like esterase
MEHINTYLALGDSYTIGEGVALHDSFPYQAVQILRHDGVKINAPEIVAKTGWTTSQLAEHISKTHLDKKYDFVTLLIGVNNQYCGLSAEDYKSEFKSLLQQAIQFAGGESERVIVLSIPDWGVTPFAEGRNRYEIELEIDKFNFINKIITTQDNAHYIDITPGTRHAAIDNSLLAEDKLHPSGKEYARWAQLVADKIKKVITCLLIIVSFLHRIVLQ